MKCRICHRHPPTALDMVQHRLIHFSVKLWTIRFKFLGASGIVLRRDSPGYYEAIGRWVCEEVEALALGEKE